MSTVDSQETANITQTQADLDRRKYLAMTEEERSIAEAQAELDRRKVAAATEKQRLQRQVEDQCAADASVAAERKREQLRVQHKALVADCRAAKNEWQKLIQEAEQLQVTFFSARGKRENAELSLSNCKASKPHPGSYPTDGELRKWENELHRLESAFSRAFAAEGEAWRSCEAARHSRNTAKENFSRLADKEADMRSRLDAPEPTSLATVTYGTPGIRIHTSEISPA